MRLSEVPPTTGPGYVRLSEVPPTTGPGYVRFYCRFFTDQALDTVCTYFG